MTQNDPDENLDMPAEPLNDTPEKPDNAEIIPAQDTPGSPPFDPGNMDDMPPQIIKQVSAFMGMFGSMPSPLANPLFDKMNDAHIDKFIDNLQRDDDNAYELKKSNRWFYIFLVVFLVLVMLWLITYLKSTDMALLLTILQILLALVGGFGAGYGVGKRS